MSVLSFTYLVNYFCRLDFLINIFPAGNNFFIYNLYMLIEIKLRIFYVYNICL